MSKKKPAPAGLEAALGALGGMANLLAADPMGGDGAGTSALPLSDIHPDPDQPRRRFDEIELQELAASIIAMGVIQPIVVRQHPALPGQWMIVAGERRWRAATIAGLETIRAVVDERDETDRRLVQIVENVQRADLDPMDVVAGYQELMIRHELTAADIAGRTGKSKQVVGEYLAVLKMPVEFRDALAARSVRDVTVLNQLWRMFDKRRDQVLALLASATPEKPITRSLVRAMTDESTAAVLSGPGSAAAVPKSPSAAGEGKTPAKAAKDGAGQGGNPEGSDSATTSPATAKLPCAIKVVYEGQQWWVRYDQQRADGGGARLVLLANGDLTMYAPLSELTVIEIAPG